MTLLVRNHLFQLQPGLGSAAIGMIVKVHLNLLPLPDCGFYYRNKLRQFVIRIIIAITGTAIGRFTGCIPSICISTVQTDVRITAYKRCVCYCAVRKILKLWHVTEDKEDS